MMALKSFVKFGNKIRLYLTLILLGTLSSCIIAYALYSMHSLSKDVAVVSERVFPTTKVAIEMEGLIKQVVEKINVAKATSTESALESIAPINQRILDLLDELLALCESCAENELLGEAGQLRDAYVASYDAGFKMVLASIEMEYEEEAELMEVFSSKNKLMRDILGKIVSSSSSTHKKNMDHVLQLSQQVILYMFIGFGLLSVIGISSFWLISNMSKKLQSLSEESSQSASALLSSMGQLSEMSVQLSNETTSSASNLDQIRSTSEMMAESAKDNVDIARTAESSTQQVLTTSTQSGEAIGDVVGAMGEMNESAREISSLVKDVEDIAFQTNLLALNAAVEAARAGEAGAGFAVVADEVRSLAGRATEASQKIATLIDNLDGKIDQGEKVVAALESSFPEVHKSAEEVSVKMTEIINNSSKQADNQVDVSSSISTIDQSVQSLAAMSEESAATVQEVTDQVARLNELVYELMIFWEGSVAGDEVTPQKGEVDPDQLLLT